MNKFKKVFLVLTLLFSESIGIAQQSAQSESNDDNNVIQLIVNGNIAEAKKLILMGKGNNNGSISYAVFWGHKEIVSLLLGRGVDPNIHPGYIDLPIIKACEKNNIDMVKVLLTYGAELNVSNYDGATPLHIAAKMGNINIVRILVESGADLLRRENRGADGKTALAIARENNQEEVVVYLEKALAQMKSESLFFPVQNGYLILPKNCSPDTEISWDPNFDQIIPGLKPGAKVSGFTQDGVKVENATLSSISCVQGECQGNYVGIKIDSWNENDRFGVIWKTNGSEKVTALFKSESTKSACQPIPKFSKNYEVQLEQTCSTFTPEGDLKGKFLIEVISQGEMQENDWPIYQTYFRALWDGFSEKRKATSWKFLGSDTKIKNPWLISFQKNSDPKLIFINFSGICCPAGGSTHEIKVEKSGILREGHIFEAGGQPCD